MPRFVVLWHETPPGYSRPSHYDLMLEHGDILRTWALAALPSIGASIPAEQLPDHRTHYLDYEGLVSGARGSAARVDFGAYDLIEDSASRLIIRLRGQQLVGRLTLARDPRDPHRWYASVSTE